MFYYRIISHNIVLFYIPTIYYVRAKTLKLSSKNHLLIIKLTHIFYDMVTILQHLLNSRKNLKTNFYLIFMGAFIGQAVLSCIQKLVVSKPIILNVPM